MSVEEDSILRQFYYKKQRSAEIDKFKEETGAEEKSGYHCPGPFCHYGVDVGILWKIRGADNEFVCSRCRHQYQIHCLDLSNQELWDSYKAHQRQKRQEKKEQYK